MARPPLSLKARALQLLAQREHSRSELRRKLLPRARATCPGDAGPDEQPGPCVDKLLDWLEAHQYLSQARFVESRVHARSARFGNQRIEQELARHGARLDAEARQALKASEFERAQSVWARKFGEPAADAAGRAKQARFLAGRGFSSEVVRRVVQARDEH